MLPARESTHGFTLVELVVVLVILSISIAVVMPRIGAGWKRMEDRDFLQEFTQTLKQARLVAMNSGEITAFRIRGSDRLFGLGDPEKHIPENVDIYADGLDVDPETKDNLILFFPDGSLSGGNIEISFDRQRAFLITIHPLFGSVHWHRVNPR